MKRCSSLCVLVSSLALLAAAAQTPQQPPTRVMLPYGSAVVIDLKGEVNASSATGQVEPVQKGQVLPAGTSLETNKGGIVLALADGSQVLVKSHSRVVLQAPEQSAGSFLQLLLGKLLAKVQKRMGQEPSFKVGTPTAVITVRGTFFGVEVTKRQKTYVQVYEGLVEVRGVSLPGQTIQLPPGYATEVESDRPPQQPHRMQEGESYSGPGSSSGEREDDGIGGRGSQRSSPSDNKSGADRSGNENDSPSRPQQQGRPERPD